MLKKLITGALIVLVVSGLVELTLNLDFWSIIIGLVAGAIVVIILVARASGQKPEHVVREVVKAAQEAVSEPQSVVDERAAHEQLLRACIAFIIGGGGSSLKEEVQNIVEQLRGIVPRAIEFAPGSETTFNLLKLAREDLPTQLRSFVDMSVNDQAQAREKFALQLQKLGEKLSRLAEFIDGGRKSQFETESAFIDLKFN